MKITDVRALQPIAENSPADWRTSLGQILIAIDTDEGITGYGVGGGGLAGIHVVQSVLRDLLVNQDPDVITDHWQAMYDATLAFGRKGIAIMAISGVDLALWDLRGKVKQTPIAVLLGGTVGKPIPTYVTVWNEVPTNLANQHHAFKLHVEALDPAQRVSVVVDAIRRARDVIGPEKELMIDAWMKWDLKTTLSVAEKCVDVNLAWIEEPLPPDDEKGYAHLRDNSPIPIAGGEHEFTARGFENLIEKRLHQVLQPDVNWCGGLTELIRIYELAKKAGLRVCPHRGAELWGLHAIAALDDDPLAESGRPWMKWVGGQPEIVNGFITLENASGFGVKIDEATLPL